MRRVVLSLALLAASMTGCSQEVFDSSTQFVCGSSADCAQGYECAVTATSDVPICVPASRVGDAGELCNDGSPPQTYFEDADGDGFGDPKATEDFCVPEDGFVDNSRDCDDADPLVNPDAQELCNGADSDCDGRPDRPADGDRTCPELLVAMSPGDVGAWEMTRSPDGGAFVTGEFQGTIEIGGRSLTAQSRTSVLFRLEPDGSIGWLTQISSPGVLSSIPIAATDEHVVALLDVAESIEVGGLSVPGFNEAFASRLVLAVLDADTGDALAYQQVDSADSLSDRSIAIDADGDLWLVAELSGDVNIQAQTTINGGAGRTAIPIEFSVSDQGLAYVRHAAWRVNGEDVKPLGLEMTPDGAYIAGRVTPAAASLVGHLAFFETGAGQIDLSTQTVAIERYLILSFGAQQDNNARLCGDFENMVTLGGRTFASEGGSDVAFADVDRVPAQDSLTVNASTSISSKADVSCFDFEILPDGSDISAHLINTTVDVDIDGNVSSPTPDLDAELLIGRDSRRSVEWVRRLESTMFLSIEQIASLGNDSFIVAASSEGRLRVEGDWLGEDQESNGFLLIYRNP